VLTLSQSFESLPLQNLELKGSPADHHEQNQEKHLGHP
jgi:hypothetical protein